jgi:plasmid stabilization system protein ParE
MAHEVLIPPKVAAEIEAIGHWIADDNPTAARRMMERLYRRCLSLDHFPERGRPYGPSYRAIDERPMSSSTASTHRPSAASPRDGNRVCSGRSYLL